MPEGKIVKALSGFYYVLYGNQLIQCRGRGVFRKNKITPLVGDEVVFQAENAQEGYILEIKERKNELIRPPIANVDQAILVFSAVEPDFSPVLLDRFLVLIEYSRIQPLICVTKLDLAAEDEVKQIEHYKQQYEACGYNVILTSSKDKTGTESLKSYIINKISVFAGQSGVGKSSLLNALRPDLELKTSRISSHLGRGRHTTRHVELIAAAGGLIADTPGFSSLDFGSIEAEELTYCFPEFQKTGVNCKFRGCQHLREPNCAVKAAVEAGKIPGFRYEHYIDFLQEIKDRKPRY